MKKIIPLLLLLFSLVGCSCVTNNNSCVDDVIKDIQITEIDRFNFEWDRVEFPIELGEDALKKVTPINTTEDAVDIATSIIEELHNDGRMSEYVLLSVTHSKEENIWCFEYSTEVDTLVECGGLYVAIDGNEGKLIKAWVEE